MTFLNVFQKTPFVLEMVKSMVGKEGKAVDLYFIHVLLSF